MRRPVFELLDQLPDDARRLETYLASLPSGADPLTHGSDQARKRLSQIALFPMLSIPDDRIPNQPIIEDGQLIGVEIHEALHRFLPAVDAGIDPQQIAVARVSWRLAPHGYVGRPGTVPPPTPLRPDQSQRFVMEGNFYFDDSEQSGFRGFSVGRTFPCSCGRTSPLRLAAMVEILEGHGAFFGRQGNIGINGIVEPPAIMRLAVMPNLFDFDGHLTTREPLPPVSNPIDPNPEEVFVIFRGELPADQAFSIVPMRDDLLLTYVDLPLRETGVQIRARPRLVSYQSPRPSTGHFRTNFWIGPMDGDRVVPFQGVGGHYDLQGPDGEPLGSFDADVVEGRARPFQLPGLDAPAYRLAGIGPINRGTGIFEGTRGFVTLVGAMSIFPRTMVFYYIVRLDDPTGRIREALSGGRCSEENEGKPS